MHLIFKCIIIGFMLATTGCNFYFAENYAPVDEIPLIEPIPTKGMHRVMPDETLYSIAWRYGLDYNELAKRNHIPPPYHVRSGQIIYLKKEAPVSLATNHPLTAPTEKIPAMPNEPEIGKMEENQKNKMVQEEHIKHERTIIKTIPNKASKQTLSNKGTTELASKKIIQKNITEVKISHLNNQQTIKEQTQVQTFTYKKRIDKEPTLPVRHWMWPSKGRIINRFSYLNRGLNFGGQLGDPIFATAAGKVVYSGNGLRRYGNLIIIKHNSNFLTAYAHNSRVLVDDGDWVKAGQKIAEMGNTGANRVMLHFEIRDKGKPVDPLLYLKK